MGRQATRVFMDYGFANVDADTELMMLIDVSS